jgi:hypothetical protein
VRCDLASTPLTDANNGAPAEGSTGTSDSNLELCNLEHGIERLCTVQNTPFVCKFESFQIHAWKSLGGPWEDHVSSNLEKKSLGGPRIFESRESHRTY